MTLPSGLRIQRNLLTNDECETLVSLINRENWSHELSRKTQQYGYKYDYGSRSVGEEAPAMPSWLSKIRDRIYPEANCCIINHYYPGQGISAHLDNFKFGDIIATISLGSSCKMNFIEKTPISPQKIGVMLYPGDVVRMTGDARYKWLHEIPAQKIDIEPETKIRIKRTERISITFRKFG